MREGGKDGCLGIYDAYMHTVAAIYDAILYIHDTTIICVYDR